MAGPRGAALWIVLGVVTATLGLSAAEPVASACPPGRVSGARGDRLLVGFSAVPPFVTMSTTDSEVRGIAIDLLRALAVREGWRLDLIELSPETLRTRLARCELDLGVLGVPVNVAQAGTLDLSLPYLSTVTTVMVRGDDSRAEPVAGDTRLGRLGHALLRGAIYGLVALVLLALASWLLNLFTGSSGRHALRWRRLDVAVSGPWAGLRWLLRSTTGRVLAIVWVLAGTVLGATAGSTHPLVLGADPLRGLVERASHAEGLLGERIPDGQEVPCAIADARTCFRGFAHGTTAAIAGPREVLCTHATELAIGDAVIRDDLAIPEYLVYLLPPASPLRAQLDLAMLRHHEDLDVEPPDVPCPGDSP